MGKLEQKEMNHTNRAIFLDRDGVVNKAIIKNGKPYPPKKVSEIIFVKGITKFLKFFSKNYYIILITNQPDYARKITLKKNIISINNYLKKKLKIDKIYTCFHDDKDRCNCRKPKPGFFYEAKKKYKLNFNNCYMIGDRFKDIEASNMAGIKGIFIDYKYKEKKPKKFFKRVNSIEEAMKIIMGDI